MHALRFQVQCGQLAHFPRAVDEHAAASEVAENLARQSHRGVAHGHCTGSQAGFRTHALADGKRGVKQAIEHRTGGLDFCRDGVRLLDLSKNLWLAHHQ